MRTRIFTLHLVALSRNANPPQQADQRYYVFANIHIHNCKVTGKRRQHKGIKLF